ncbi:MAG: sensor histidine kinase, partial [Pyrinomonadaceae bacterium]|nr:sensor histidine kinase [Sphingobacteriaceae bacterium]
LKAKINKNIGAVFLSWKNLSKALYYYNIAQELAIKGNDKITEADCLNNKGTVYEQQNNYQKAFEVYSQALKIYTKANINQRIALTYNNLAILSKVAKKFNDASHYYKQSVIYADKANNAWLTAAISTNLGNLLTEMGQLSEGQIYLQKALTISTQIDAKELIYETLENLAENASRSKDFNKAYLYHKQFSKAQNDFINLENTKEVAKLQAEFESEKKEKALAKSRAQFLQSRLEINRKNNLLNYAILGLLAIGSLTLLVFRNSRVKQQKLKLENEFNLKLASAEARNQLQEEKLRISRELHDNIGSQLTFINSSIQNLDEGFEDNEVLTETRKITQNTIAELRRTVWLINKQEVDLDEFIIKLRDYVKPMQTNSPHFQIEISYTGNCSLNSLTATNLFRIIQEGINNSVKYAKANLLTVKINCTENKLDLAIADNGVGFSIANASEGYGIKNIKTRVEALKGECAINSVIGKGTNINVNIPV